MLHLRLLEKCSKAQEYQDHKEGRANRRRLQSNKRYNTKGASDGVANGSLYLPMDGDHSHSLSPLTQPPM